MYLKPICQVFWPPRSQSCGQTVSVSIVNVLGTHVLETNRQKVFGRPNLKVVDKLCQSHVRTFWNNLEFFGIIWNYLEKFGIIWNNLDFFGIIWIFLE